MDTSALMIYPDKGVAEQIVGKLQARHPTVKWTVKQTPLGFQIFRVGKAFNPVVTPVNAPPRCELGHWFGDDQNREKLARLSLWSRLRKSPLR